MSEDTAPRRRAIIDSPEAIAEVYKTNVSQGSDDEIEDRIDPNTLVPTGSTLLDLALSDHLQGGWQLGKIVNVVGDSSSGKTLLVLTGLAEMANDPRFEDYLLVYDDVEAALEFDLAKLFGSYAASRIQPPVYNSDGSPGSSNTTEDMYRNILTYLKQGVPFVYVTDSLDALTCDAEEERASNFVKSGDSKDISASFKTEKPRLIGEMLRLIKAKLRDTKSLVIIVSQTREKIGVTFGEKKTRTGGNALTFYCQHEVWLHHKGHIKKKNRTVGADVLVKVKKNKLTGKRGRSLEFSTLFGYGVDDISSMVDFLMAEGIWTGSARKVKCTGLDVPDMSKEALISHIEENDLIQEVKELVLELHLDIEEELKPKRKPRFDE